MQTVLRRWAQKLLKIYDQPDFRVLPPDIERLFSEGESFFDQSGWYDLVARFGMRPGWKPVVVADDDASAAFVLQHNARGDFASCVNPYSCEHAVLGYTQAIARLARAFASEPGKFRVLLRDLDPGAPAFSASLEGFRAAGFKAMPFFGWGNWSEDVAGQTFEDYLSARPSSLTNTGRRKLAALQKGSRVSFRIHRFGEDLERFVADYEDVRCQSWQEAEPFPLFIPELIRLADRLGILRMGALKIDGENAAAQFWIVWKKKALIFKLAYADRFRGHSPGTLLTSHMLEHIFETDSPDEIDFGRGDDEYKKLWVSTRRERWGIEAVNPRTVRGALLAARMTLANMRKHTRAG
jgi:hypothetical protein